MRIIDRLMQKYNVQVIEQSDSLLIVDIYSNLEPLPWMGPIISFMLGIPFMFIYFTYGTPLYVLIIAVSCLGFGIVSLYYALYLYIEVYSIVVEKEERCLYSIQEHFGTRQRVILVKENISPHAISFPIFEKIKYSRNSSRGASRSINYNELQPKDDLNAGSSKLWFRLTAVLLVMILCYMLVPIPLGFFTGLGFLVDDIFVLIIGVLLWILAAGSVINCYNKKVTSLTRRKRQLIVLFTLLGSLIALSMMGLVISATMILEDFSYFGHFIVYVMTSLPCGYIVLVMTIKRELWEARERNIASWKEQRRAKALETLARWKSSAEQTYPGP